MQQTMYRWMVIFTRISCRQYTTFSPHDYWGISDWFSADSDMVTDRLPEGSTDESDDTQMDMNFPMTWSFKKFCTAILMGIFTMNLAYGWTDRTDNGHTDGWMEFQVESCLG